jgi:hypothetical protein
METNWPRFSRSSIREDERRTRHHRILTDVTGSCFTVATGIAVETLAAREGSFCEQMNHHDRPVALNLRASGCGTGTKIHRMDLRRAFREEP